jgi:hypothetical protein
MKMRLQGNLMNRIMESAKTIHNSAPVVGLGCTITMYTDRRAATIVAVKTPSKIIVQEDNAVAKHQGMTDSQDWELTPDPTGRLVTFTKRKDGSWRESNGTNGLLLGHRRHFHDYSF